ncbi:hypothetical protein GIB67_007433 [Kingdonia uniflora]|uniref:cytokinin dehydrogenase n=1 Tax=Kingdonia uniflora TaxID=39325 RepID=A0A7J7MLM8_9MAGN|nr:hypothetical protein GIB67_007433 [Kingdonia uniflora]
MVCKLMLMFLFFLLTSTVVLALDLSKLHGNISFNSSDIKAASLDFGRINHVESLAVMYPNSEQDIVHLVKKALSTQGFNVSARGKGHSAYGQAQVAGGVVIDMSSTTASLQMRRKPVQGRISSYVDVWGGDQWINVLNYTLPHGLAPKSWTDYLHVTVGGTLSYAGIGGQTYLHGPQISNVYELDVVTGKGELKTCSKEQNTELFCGVLGGLGQFGIITRARISLESAPGSVILMQLTYYDFSVFTKDQEYLISLHEKPASERFDSLLGSVSVDTVPIKYNLEVVKYIYKSTTDAVNQEVDVLLAKLDSVSITRNILSYTNYLERLWQLELDLRSKGLWDVPHPGLSLLVPKSSIRDFDKGVIKGIIGNNSNGNLYCRWDPCTSAVTPEGDVFYSVWLLRTTGKGNKAIVDFIMNQNQEILNFCKKAEIKVRQYLPYYEKQKEWVDHYGDKWDLFRKRKMEFDPKHILATGQHIF